MKWWLERALIAGALLGIGGFLVAASGIISIKASSGHWPVTEWFLRFSMKRSIATHSLTVTVPENLSDPALIEKGAGHYDIGCRSCHGEPDMPRPRIAAHMLPMPPDLATRIPHSNPKKLFYVVKHGMKFTGMPAWPSVHRDDEVWSMVAFLLQYPQLDGAGYRRLVGRNEIAAAANDNSATQPLPNVVVQSCVRCHGDDGLNRNNPTLPKLAGQRAEYLRGALDAFAIDRRHSGIMGPVASTLTPAAIEEAVTYYAGLHPSHNATGSPNQGTENRDTRAAIERGERIVFEGIREQRVPACVECHGPTARRGKPQYPLLASQPAAYLELQLDLFRNNARGGSDHAHVMAQIASRLAPEQARDVAHYFASLPTLHTETTQRAVRP
jgi:cytochrome c553